MSQPAPVQYYICCGSRELGVHHSACQRDGAARWDTALGHSLHQRANFKLKYGCYPEQMAPGALEGAT